MIEKYPGFRPAARAAATLVGTAPELYSLDAIRTRGEGRRALAESYSSRVLALSSLYGLGNTMLHDAGVARHMAELYLLLHNNYRYDTTQAQPKLSTFG